MTDLGSKLRGAIEPLLEPGERLDGVCVGSQVGVFRGRQVAIGVTERRLVVQGVNRRFEPDGEPLSLPPERLAAAQAEGGGRGWLTLGAAIMDGVAVTLKLRTNDGEKLKLMLMRASGPFESLAGGEVQRQGIEALGEWFAAAGA